MHRALRLIAIMATCALAGGCASFGPQSLQQTRLQYNEVVKATAEEELLLNIVRLRYTDTPSSLAVSTIAAQHDLNRTFQLTPFFVASGAEVAKTSAAVLPQLGIGGTDRPTASVTARDMVEAAKSGYEYRLDEPGTKWTLIKKTQRPILFVDPRAVDSLEMVDVARAFRLKRGLIRYPITQSELTPFPRSRPGDGLTALDVETRSLLQALYYVSHGIDIPVEHAATGLVTVTRDASGQAFDWRR